MIVSTIVTELIATGLSVAKVPLFHRDANFSEWGFVRGIFTDRTNRELGRYSGDFGGDSFVVIEGDNESLR